MSSAQFTQQLEIHWPRENEGAKKNKPDGLDYGASPSDFLTMIHPRCGARSKKKTRWKEKKIKSLAADSFDLSTSGLWARRASAAPCCFPCCLKNMIWEIQIKGWTRRVNDSTSLSLWLTHQTTFPNQPRLAWKQLFPTRFYLWIVVPSRWLSTVHQYTLGQTTGSGIPYTSPPCDVPWYISTSDMDHNGSDLIHKFRR